MAALTDADTKPADTGTDERPSIAHCFLNVGVSPPPWVSLCGAKEQSPPFKYADPDAEKCVVCLDLSTH